MEAGVIFSIFLAVYAVGQLPIGVLAVRFNPAKLMGLGLMLSGLGMLFTAFAPNYYAILAFQALAGLGGSAHHPLSLRLISEVFPREQRGRVLGIHSFSSSLGFTLTPAVVAALADWGWRLPLILYAVLGFAAGIFMVSAVKHEFKPVIPLSPRRLFRIQGFKRLLSMFMLMTLTARGVGNFLPLFLIATYGVSAAQSGYYYALFYLTGMVQPLIGYLADLVERRKITMLSLVLSPIFIVLLALSPLKNPIPLLVAAGLGVWSLVVLHDSLATDLMPREAWGLGYGVLFTASMASAALASTLTGLLIQNLGFTQAYVALALIYLAEIPLLAGFRQNKS